jgi:inorganic pyrophosphatase
MWIFMNDAFFSVVKDRNNEDGVVVRARVEGDLENVFGSDKKVIVTDDSDYRFRLFLDQEYVKNVIANRIENINYPNFKNSINKTDYERKRYYTDVWGVMYDWQDKLYKSYNSWLSYRNQNG